MITAEQLDKLCVLTTQIIEGDTHNFTEEDWEFLDEVAVHAEDVIRAHSSFDETDETVIDVRGWIDHDDEEGYEENYGEFAD